MNEIQPAPVVTENAEKIVAVGLEVVDVYKHAPLRLTEVGAQPLVAGEQFLVPDRVARDLLERHPKHLKVFAHAKPVAKLEKGTYEMVTKAPKEEPKKADEKAVDTEKAQPVSAEGQPANKSMAGKGKTKEG